MGLEKPWRADTTGFSASSWGTKNTGGLWVVGTGIRRARLTYPRNDLHRDFEHHQATSPSLQSVSGLLFGATLQMAVHGSNQATKAHQTQSATNCTYISDDDLNVFGLTVCEPATA